MGKYKNFFRLKFSGVDLCLPQTLPLYTIDNTEGEKKVSIDSSKKYFLPRVKTENYNIEIDGTNFYDQPINDSITQYEEVTKISTGQGDDYGTRCLLDFAYFEKKLQTNCS